MSTTSLLLCSFLSYYPLFDRCFIIIMIHAIEISTKAATIKDHKSINNRWEEVRSIHRIRFCDECWIRNLFSFLFAHLQFYLYIIIIWIRTMPIYTKSATSSQQLIVETTSYWNSQRRRKCLVLFFSGDYFKILVYYLYSIHTFMLEKVVSSYCYSRKVIFTK